MMQTPIDKTDEGPPPFLQTWPRVYAAVIGYLVLLIGALAIFSRLLAP
ncbi:MAG TPA: hypothetical protein VHZ55_06085 [Bryobacteraceae bacterium]|nr:hypothetical protein [Bryobacteraceae bacterium]